MKKKILFFLLFGLSVCIVYAQSDIRLKNHHIIFNGEIASGNLYTMAISSVMTGFLNYYLLNDAFFENSFSYTLYSPNENNIKIKTLNPMGLTASELFNNVQTGIKLGYQTYRPEFLNAGVYVSAHYKLDQFKVGNGDNISHHRTQRALFGVNGLISLGSMEQPSRVIIEIGLRYSLPLAYKSPVGWIKERLNDGFVSHYAVMVASRGMWQNIGIYADINHFDLLKNFDSGKRLNNYTFGITWTITPQQVNDRKN